MFLLIRTDLRGLVKNLAGQCNEKSTPKDRVKKHWQHGYVKLQHLSKEGNIKDENSIYMPILSATSALRTMGCSSRSRKKSRRPSSKLVRHMICLANAMFYGIGRKKQMQASPEDIFKSPMYCVSLPLCVAWTMIWESHSITTLSEAYPLKPRIP